MDVCSTWTLAKCENEIINYKSAIVSTSFRINFVIFIRMRRFFYGYLIFLPCKLYLSCVSVWLCSIYTLIMEPCHAGHVRTHMSYVLLRIGHMSVCRVLVGVAMFVQHSGVTSGLKVTQIGNNRIAQFTNRRFSFEP